MGRITADQSQTIMATLAMNVDWSKIDFDELGLEEAIIRDPKGAGARFGAFLCNKARFMIKGPSALIIDRAKLPTPEQFIDKNWSKWFGPKDGDGLSGEPDEDSRSVILTEVDFANAQFVHCLTEGENVITGEEKLVRMKNMPNIRYDFGVGVSLHQEKGQVTLRWLYDTHGITWFELTTVLRNPGGHRGFLCLVRRDDGLWYWHCHWLSGDRVRDDVSPVSAS